MTAAPVISTPEPPMIIGPVTVGPVAHGGHCVARHEGRVIFVRHALPGEQVMITITDVSRPSFWRGDATEILRPSPDRVEPPCPVAVPSGCGGCDFQHVALPAQRRLKADVLAEQLQRLAGIELRVPVEPVPSHTSTGDGLADDGPADDGPADDGPADDGLGWRTRMRYQLDDHGRPALRAHRSHRLVPLPEGGCRIAADPIARPAGGQPGQELIGVAAADGAHWAVAASADRGDAGAAGADSRPGGDLDTPAGGYPGELPRLQPGSEQITQHAAGRDWTLALNGFWQVHPAAADLLVHTVLDRLRPAAGETAFDLYCGVGLFTGALVDAGCRVVGVESNRAAVDAARHNLADAGPAARFVAGRVDRALRQPHGRGALPDRTDLIVLDPPRSGAGRQVVEQVVRRRPRAIAYVACDPAALARDLGYLAGHGYRLESLRAFDLFPMTQHFECVAIVTPRP